MNDERQTAAGSRARHVRGSLLREARALKTKACVLKTVMT